LRLPDQLAVQGTADAQAEIDRQNAEQRAGIDATLGGTLSAFDQWTAAAQGRADAARGQLGSATAAAADNSDQYAADFEAAMAGAAIANEAAKMTEAAGGGVPGGLKGGVSGTFSAAAASFTVTRLSARFERSMVVSASCSASISPRPL
jgi:hypothetical protein